MKGKWTMLLAALLAGLFATSTLAGQGDGYKEVRKGWEEEMGYGIQARDGSCGMEFTLLGDGIKEEQSRHGEDEYNGDPDRFRDPTLPH